MSSPLYMLLNADNDFRPMRHLGRTCFNAGEANALAADWRNRGYDVVVAPWASLEDSKRYERYSAVLAAVRGAS